MPEPRCWICQNPHTEAFPLYAVDEAEVTLVCSRHLPAIDLTEQDNGAYEI